MVKKVLVSKGFGAGWSTWNETHGKDLAEDAELIRMVEAGEHRGRTTYKALEQSGITDSLNYGKGEQEIQASHAFALRACHITGGDVPYMGGVADLEVVEVNGPYRITEYDGAESIEERDSLDWW